MHGGLEKPVGAATAGLGAIERQIGVLEQLVGVGAVVGCDRDADAGIDHDLAVIEVVRQCNRVAESSGKSFRVGGLSDLGLDHRKLVPAQSSHQIGFADTVAQAVGDRPQQIVADRMAQRIVDILEVVEIEVKNGQPLTAHDPFERLLEPLPKQHPVCEAGERVVMGHVDNLGIGLLAVADIFVGHDPSAIGHRALHDMDGASIAGMEIGAGRLPPGNPPQDIAAILFDVFRQSAGFLAILNQFDQRALRFQAAAREPVHFEIAIVADDDLTASIHHHQALAHVVQGEFEAKAVGLEVELRRLRRRASPLQPAKKCLKPSHCDLTRWQPPDTLAWPDQGPTARASKRMMGAIAP